MTKKVVLAITGGGTEVIGNLLRRGGASSYFLEAVVPYATEALDNFLGFKPEKYCTERTARQMAHKCYERACRYGVSCSDALGIGVTAILGKPSGEREGRQHYAYISIRTDGNFCSYLLKLNHPERKTREQEEFKLGQTIQALINTYIGDSFPAINKTFNPEELTCVMSMVDIYGTDSIIYHKTVLGLDVPDKALIYPGSFNPIHHGHINTAKFMYEKTGKPVYFEISMNNSDKGSIDFVDINQRVELFKQALAEDPEFMKSFGGLIISRFPEFYQKLWRYNNCQYILGRDTAVRLFQAKYGRSSFVGPESEKMIDLCKMQEYPIFYVMPRRGYDFDVRNTEIAKFFELISEADYQDDGISSSQIRAATL